MGDAAMRLLCLLALAGAGLALAACGGSAPPPAPGSPERPLVAEQTRLGGGGAAGGRSNEAASARPRATPGYEALLKNQARRPRRRFTPCNLVTAAQARAIVGAPMAEPVEAAQGPTCIYRTRDGRSFVTVAVQGIDFRRLASRLHGRRRTAVAGRTAYCGTYGQPMLYVALARGRVLTIGAQCAVARRFARRAVRQLPG
jgi:Protein of unknown function (DUF3558)